MQLQEALLHRRTLHKFGPDVPPFEAILRAADLARWAQNHKLTEPWKLYVMGPKAMQATLDYAYDHFLKAKGEEEARQKRQKWAQRPGMFLATQRLTPGDPLREREDYGACCCFLQNLMLALWEEGLGGQWGSGAITREDAFHRLHGINPEREQIVGLFAYGYAAEAPRSVRHKAAAEICTQIP